ncbi:hypothetical protein BC941DRAFT_497163 [Chlamydoabsidia padenii]|nr:hypothetical protein BC941DRAFT_497163 [Chlamydoabsidia padenii]
MDPPKNTVQFAERSPSIIPSPVYSTTSINNQIMSPPSSSHLTRTTVTGSMRRSNFALDTFQKEEKTLSEESMTLSSRFTEHQEEYHELYTRSGGTDKHRGGFIPLATTDENEEDNLISRQYNDPPLSPPPTKIRAWLEKPWFSWISALIMITILVYELIHNATLTGSIIQTSPNFNPMIGPSFYTLITMGAKFTPCMRSIPNYTPTTMFQDCYHTGETCPLATLCDSIPPTARFFYPIFMHAGIIHFLMNMLTHLRLGVDLERALGLPRYIFLYFAAGIFGNVLSAMLAQPAQASMGASGALFGLIGFMFVDVVVNWKLIRNPVRELMGLLISTVISLILGLLPGKSLGGKRHENRIDSFLFDIGLDNFAHLGGFVVGLVMGMMIAPMRPMASTRTRWITWGLRGLALIILVVLFVVCITTFYNSADPANICPGCKYLGCLPVSNWCDY